jgi:RNA-directed DNA polymerase
METKLAKIAELAKSQPRIKFTSLVHYLNEDSLKQCHHELPNNKASGINGTTKDQYEKNLDVNIQELLSSLKRNSYRPIPVRRLYIPKAGTDKKRPLGIPTVNSYCTPPNSVFHFRLGLLRPSSYFT